MKMHAKNNFTKALFTKRHHLPNHIPSEKIERKHCIAQNPAIHLRRHHGMLVYLYLKNKQNFWFYVVHSDDNMLYGYLRRGNGWKPHVLILRQVEAYY